MLRASALFAALLLCVEGTALAQDQNAYEQGVEARLSGDAAAAVALLLDWVAAHPGDVDARVQLGYAYLALGELDRAESEFRTVLARTPEYTDAAEGLALAQARRASGSDRRITVMVEGAVSALGNGLRDWNEIGAELTLPLAGRDTFNLRGSWHERFGLKDVEAAALYTARATHETWLRLGASATPSADFRPEVGLVAGIDHRLSQGSAATVVGIETAWRKFPLQDVYTVSPAITQYFGDAGEFSLSARANALVADGDSLRVGGSLRADFAPGNRARAFAGVAAGPDTDLGVVTDTYSLFGGGEVPLDNRLSLVGSIAREWRDGPADRTEFRMGLKVHL